MKRLNPEEIYSVLDLDKGDLRRVRTTLSKDGAAAALAALLEYYRRRRGVWYPSASVLAGGAPEVDVALARARQTLKHVFMARESFEAMGYKPRDYGPDIDWNANPVQDINWVACMHRFTWDESLAAAYVETKNSKLAAGWVGLADDWIRKNPVDTGWDGFSYAPLQVGVRSWRWCGDFEIYKGAAGFTPEFLRVFLAAVYDQAQKTMLHPQLSHHNPTIVEAEGLLCIGLVFPEFLDAESWCGRALEILTETLRRQVTGEGVQREWSINYHIACLGRVLGIVDLLNKNKRSVPAGFIDTAEKMSDYLFAAISPDRLYPMFGDARRPSHDIAGALRRAAKVFGKPEYGAVLDERTGDYPSQRCFAFAESGMYFLRSGWDRDAVYMALHCSPPAASSHDQPDNGTFELHAFERWLMPDSGCYAYGHGTEFEKERWWFRGTAAHQTLTLDGKDSVNAPKHLLWVDDDELTAVTFENASYPGLTHRRTVFFVEKSFFVIVDEAIGDASGEPALHFQLAPGDAALATADKSAHTGFADANVLVWAPRKWPVEMVEEKGQVSFQFHKKEARPAFAWRGKDGAPATFLTVLVPYRGTEPPAVTASLSSDYEIGDDLLELTVGLDDCKWRLGRDLAESDTWCALQPGSRLPAAVGQAEEPAEEIAPAARPEPEAAPDEEPETGGEEYEREEFADDEEDGEAADDYESEEPDWEEEGGFEKEADESDEAGKAEEEDEQEEKVDDEENDEEDEPEEPEPSKKSEVTVEAEREEERNVEETPEESEGQEEAEREEEPESGNETSAAPKTPAGAQEHIVEPENALPEVTLADLPEILREACLRMGWQELMPVQAKTIPYVLAKRDLMIQSHTGSGKTAAFLLPILDRLDAEKKAPQALILVPTRELAKQVAHEAEVLGKDTGILTAVVYGGVGYGPQFDALRAGAQLIVGTPGRILDHLLRRSLSLKELDILVFDEADRMLSMGFYPDMREVQTYLPSRRVNGYMFSATFPSHVLGLASLFLDKPEFLSLSRDHVHVTDTEHAYYLVPGMEKDRALVRIIEVENPTAAIIFCNTRQRVHYVTVVLQRFGYDVDELSSDLTQKAREKVLQRLRDGRLRFLAATDVAARGIDIPELTHIILYDVPDDHEDYIHRAGRTGRAGAAGEALSLVDDMEEIGLERIAKHYNIDLRKREVPTDEDVRMIVTERVTALLEAKLRARDKLQVERMQRLVPLARGLGQSDDELALIAMLLDDYYQETLHSPPPQPPAAPEESERPEPPRRSRGPEEGKRGSRRGGRRGGRGRRG